MKVLRIREGFATNSSSSHSIVLTDGNLSDTDVEYEDFGWNTFIAASEKYKRKYMAYQLYYALREVLPEEPSRVLAEKYTEARIGDGSIDHQSVFSLPYNVKGDYVHIGFFKELLEYILNPKIAIVGGNDNCSHEEGGFSLPGEVVNIGLLKDSGHDFVARKDRDRGYWTLFNKRSGTKLHITFGKDIKADRAYAPELVDLKITDFCTKGCKYCYQDSSPIGKHAKIDKLWGIFEALKNIEVFEVAIGGGEPLSHPEFVNILLCAKECGITPNFSTKEISWIHSPERREAILPNVGGFAYSVENSSQAREFGRLVNFYGIGTTHQPFYKNTKATIQTIPGLLYHGQLGRILEAAYNYDLPCTLLGVKTSGRGQEALTAFNSMYGVNSRKPSYWLDVVRNLRKDKRIYPRVGIDTCLANDSQKALDENKISKKKYYTKEGIFSMYIDGVSMKMGPSSFCPENEMVSFEGTDWEDQIMAAFKSFK